MNNSVIEENNSLNTLLMESRFMNTHSCMLITPYTEEIGNQIADLIRKSDIIIPFYKHLNIRKSEDYVNYGNNELYKFIENNYKTCYGDIIISCTNLPTFHLIEQIEADFHVTVLTNNQSILFTILSSLKIPYNSFGIWEHYLGEVYDNK